MPDIINYLQSNTDIDLTQFSNMENMWDILKCYINRKVKRIKVNFKDILSDIDYLYYFNLDVLELCDFVLDEDLILILSTLDVKKVLVSSFDIKKEDLFKFGIYMSMNSDDSLNSFFIGNSLLRVNNCESVKVLEFDSIWFLNESHLDLSDFKNLEFIKLNSKYYNFEYNVKERKFKVDSIDVSIFCSFLIFLDTNNFQIDDIHLQLFSIDYDSEIKDLNFVLNFCKNNKISNVVIKNTHYTVVFKDNKIKQLKIEVDNVKEANEICNKINFPIENLYISINNTLSERDTLNASFSGSLTIENKIDDLSNLKTAMVSAKSMGASTFISGVYEIDKYDESYDYSVLDDISKELGVYFKYEKTMKYIANRDEYISLVEAIKWYRKIIKDYDLSPAEKLMVAYDIAKTFSYSTNNYSGEDFRAPHNVISNGKIVCAGYCFLINEIVNGIDPNLSTIRDSIKNANHAINVIRIDDDKYDIHGVYAADVTNDSCARKDSIVNQLGENYNALDLYQYFLVNYLDYKIIFPNYDLPYAFSYVSDNTKNVGLFDNIQLNILFSGSYSLDKLRDYAFKARRIDFKDFKEMLKNVRLAQGFSEDSINDEINRVILNNSIQAYVMKNHDNMFMEELHGRNKSA